MTPSLPSSDQNSPTPDNGAYAAWGLILGAVLGGVVGLFIGRWLGTGLVGAGLGWVIGACIERARQP